MEQIKCSDDADGASMSIIQWFKMFKKNHNLLLMDLSNDLEVEIEELSKLMIGEEVMSRELFWKILNVYNLSIIEKKQLLHVSTYSGRKINGSYEFKLHI